MNSPLLIENSKWSNASLRNIYNVHAEALVKSIKWQSNEKIMDYGCGAGHFARKYLFPLAETNNLSLFGVDDDEEMLKYAEQHCVHPSIKYYSGNILDQDSFSFEQMDKVLTASIVPSVMNYQNFFENVFELLKSGGQFGALFTVGKPFKIAVETSKNSKWSYYAEEDETSPWAHWTCGDANIIPVESALTATGFEIVECKAYDEIIEFSTINNFYDTLILWNSILNKVPGSSHNELKRDMKSVALKCFESENLEMSPFKCKISFYRIVALKK